MIIRLNENINNHIINKRKGFVDKGILTTDLNNCRGIENQQYVRITIQTDSNMNKKLVQAIREIDD
ncbi:MAG: hypothetical protein ABIC91_08705 [Nanoarchaeota archaeon]|nr:hypothetical protein [Nanoarchaeota archaeon]MBU1030731.1 hypothetical protein [Nanoarchaeota archaeon]MBU1850601.1 hypothetical protein [Nanoarchaeota archaeon]